MGRGRRIAFAIVVAVAVLLAINTVIVDNQTEPAEVTIEGGEILELPLGDVQVYEEGPAQAQADGRTRALAAPIVLLHCYACSLRWWDRLAPLLAERHRVIRIDLLGFGGSEKPSSGYEIPEQAATVAAALDRLGVQGAVVVGHSMGFAVATALAERASQLVDRLVNIDEGPTSDACSVPFIADLGYLPVIGEAIWRTTPSFMTKNAYSAAFAPDYELEDGFDDPDQVLEDRDGMTFTSYRDASDGATDFTDEAALDDRLRTLAIPLLSIFGTEDDVCDPVESQAAYASVPGATTAEIEGAGHSPNIEKPRETAALIEEFAAEATVAPPAPTPEPREQRRQGNDQGRQAHGKPGRDQKPREDGKARGSARDGSARDRGGRDQRAREGGKRDRSGGGGGSEKRGAGTGSQGGK